MTAPKGKGGGDGCQVLTGISPNINPHLQLQQRSGHAGAVVAVELALNVEHAPPQPGVVQILAGGRVEVPGACRGGRLARRRQRRGVGRDDGVARALELLGDALVNQQWLLLGLGRRGRAGGDCVLVVAEGGLCGD